MINEIEIWWSSLPVSEKERIAKKGLTKSSEDGQVDESLYQYPECTRWWNALEAGRKKKIYDHCVGRHGLALHDWNEADPYGD